jgi:hypothetical protein
MSSIRFLLMEDERLGVYGVMFCLEENQGMEHHICMLIWQDALLGRQMVVAI